MKAAKKDGSSVFDSILVHFGSDKARFHPTHFKVHHSVITVPSAWRFKPLAHVGVTFHLPPEKSNKRERLVPCQGIIADCRPLKQKRHYHVDLLLTEIPPRYASFFKKLIPGIQPWVH